MRNHARAMENVRLFFFCIIRISYMIHTFSLKGLPSSNDWPRAGTLHAKSFLWFWFRRIRKEKINKIPKKTIIGKELSNFILNVWIILKSNKTVKSFSPITAEKYYKITKWQLWKLLQLWLWLMLPHWKDNITEKHGSMSCATCSATKNS